MLLRAAGKRWEEGVNATALPEKQEVRRKPNADGDGFMVSDTYCSIDIVLVLFMCSCSDLCWERGSLTCHFGEDLRRRILEGRWLSGPAGAKRNKRYGIFRIDVVPKS
jgi:hypothetical protein